LGEKFFDVAAYLRQFAKNEIGLSILNGKDLRDK